MTHLEVRSQKPIQKKWVFSGLIFAFLLIISSILLFLYPFSSTVKEAYFAGEHPILFKGLQVGNAIVEGEDVYLPLSFLQENIDEAILFDEPSNSIIITTKDKVVQMPSESLTYFVNEQPVDLHFSAFKMVAGEMYLAIDPLLSFYQIAFSILPDSGAVWIKEDGQEITNGTVTSEDVREEKLLLRTDTSLRSSYLTDVTQNEEVYVEGEKEDYYYVRKKDGTAGYLKKNLLTKGETETVVIGTGKEDVTVPKIEGPIHLTWEAVYTKNPNLESMPAMPGVNVISPTWFELAGGDGSIKNLGSLEFSNWAHQQGYQIWGLFSNAFDPALTHEAFRSFETRQNMIRQLLHYSEMYQLDGINFDIENVNLEDASLVTQFVREATAYFHEAGLTVSMDVTFISTSGNWSAFYEREKLKDIVDYMVVMAYDEHWGSSPVAGSVASFPWVEANLQKLLEIVPSEQLILGVPLYTRLWEEKDSGEVSSKALSMSQVKEWLTVNDVTPVYDPNSGQNYAEYYSETDQATYRIWLEDELSLSKRADIATKYDLAGVASWSRSFADETAWLALTLENEQETEQ